MGHQSSRLDFALIGHQENWQSIMLMANSVRKQEGMPVLPLRQVKEMYRFIPPRPLFDIQVTSLSGKVVKGVYIESFISPDECNPLHLRSNIGKVREACHCAARLGAAVAALGGLSSVLLEADADAYSHTVGTCFTTGNTLTAAFIVKSMEDACRQAGRRLAESRLLVIGSTGDIGSACVRYFSGKVKKMLLHARQPGPLRRQADALRSDHHLVSWSARLEELLPEATLVICAASSSILCPQAALLPPTAIVCDAGYPKNLGAGFSQNAWLYSGGLGQVKSGFRTDPDYCKDWYRYAARGVAHGCLLEAIVLAMEEKYVPFSTGRGNITVNAMEEILELAGRHGIEQAPLFGEDSAWNVTTSRTAYEAY